jgi:hypothetical protein
MAASTVHKLLSALVLLALVIQPLSPVVAQSPAPDPSGFRKPEGSTTVVLATADQLKALARLRFEPRGTDDADLLVASYAQVSL